MQLCVWRERGGGAGGGRERERGEGGAGGGGERDLLTIHGTLRTLEIIIWEERARTYILFSGGFPGAFQGKKQKKKKKKQKAGPELTYYFRGLPSGYQSGLVLAEFFRRRVELFSQLLCVDYV
jgi:hypothetical protein